MSSSLRAMVAKVKVRPGSQSCILGSDGTPWFPQCTLSLWVSASPSVWAIWRDEWGQAKDRHQ